jgi:hypothetical protein
MELLLIMVGLLALDILAMRFGADSRRLDARDLRGWWPAEATGDTSHDSMRTRLGALYFEASADRLARLASAGRPSLRVRTATSLRALAARVDPAPYAARRPSPAGGARL